MRLEIRCEKETELEEKARARANPRSLCSVKDPGQLRPGQKPDGRTHSLRRKTANGSPVSSLSWLEREVDWPGDETPPRKQSKSIVLEKDGEPCGRDQFVRRHPSLLRRRRRLPVCGICRRQLHHDPE